MNVLRDITGALATYAADTQRRMTCTVNQLRDHCWHDAASIDRMFQRVGRQEEAAEQAGFHSVSFLCEGMRDVLDEVRRGRQPWSPAVAVTLQKACRNIRRHADTVAELTGCHQADRESRAREPAVSAGPM